MKIYLITNSVNNKKYVGITANEIEERLNQHIRESRTDSRRALCRAIRKYGEDKFNIELIEETDDILRENYWINEYNTRKTGYNLTDGGEGSWGRIISEETREKNRQSQLRRFQKEGEKEKTSETTKEGMKRWWNNLSEEQKQDWLSKCNPGGRIVSEETKKKIRNSHLGRKVSEEGKRRMKKVQSNRSLEWQTKINETKKKNYDPSKNPMNNPEYREKVRLSKLGRKLTVMPDGSRKYIKE